MTKLKNKIIKVGVINLIYIPNFMHVHTQLSLIMESKNIRIESDSYLPNTHLVFSDLAKLGLSYRVKLWTLLVLLKCKSSDCVALMPPNPLMVP